jgi:hypothetical protein
MVFGLICGIITIYINRNIDIDIDDEVVETIGYAASGLLIVGSIINAPLLIIVGGILEMSIIINNI